MLDIAEGLKPKGRVDRLGKLVPETARAGREGKLRMWLVLT